VLIDEQLPSLQPDLVILDYGTNDFLYTNQVPSTLGRQIVQTINWIRQLAPDAAILLTSAQDMYRHGEDINSAKDFSNMVRQIAKQEHCGFYDWYRISGGQYAMAKWVQARLGRPDYIHLTKEGYLLKGRLFSQAFDHTYKKFQDNAMMDSLVMMNGVSGFNLDSTLVASLVKMPTLITTRHKIRNGESLSTIADKYNVSVSSIMKANNMKNSRIVAGKTLIIKHKAMRNAPPANVVAKATPAVVQKPVMKPGANVIEYKVVSGDTLGQIAEKYNTSVKDIKTLNGLRNSKIVEGKVLLIQLPN
jgi:LysM repeat protein